MRDIILIAHNLRSTHNVGSLLRTADGMGVTKVFLTGYTPYPLQAPEARLPHLAQKIDKQIHKTALGAEHSLPWAQDPAIEEVIAKLRTDGYSILALEQAKDAASLPEYRAPAHVALIVGREVAGIEPEVLQLTDRIIEIPMFGEKESLNVVQAAAMALYHFRFD